jgi:hypothetical protein
VRSETEKDDQQDHQHGYADLDPRFGNRHDDQEAGEPDMNWNGEGVHGQTFRVKSVRKQC